jgi:glycosyltransferase involved in cell wall biosynthesis
MWHGLAREFAGRGHQVTLVARSWPGQPACETADGLHYLRMGGFPQSRSIARDLVRDFGYALAILPRLPPADVLVINDFWLPALAPLRPSAGRPVLNVQRFPKRQFALYRGVRRFAAASNAIADEIRRQAPRVSARVRVFPNVVDTGTFAPGPTRDGAESVVLFAGRIHPEKGLELLVEGFRLAARSGVRARLRIVGPHAEAQGGGGRAYRDRLAALAAGLPVEISEPIFDPGALAEVYRGADVFCYPSLAARGEALPMAPIEAMACGAVPIVSRLRCFEGLVDDGRTGRVFDHESGDATARLAACLEGLLRDAPYRLALRQAALERASSLGLADTALRYLDDFATLV